MMRVGQTENLAFRVPPKYVHIDFAGTPGGSSARPDSLRHYIVQHID